MGIGTGNNAVRNLGLRAARLADWRNLIHFFRQLIAVGELPIKEASVRCRRHAALLSSPVPVLTVPAR